MIRKFLIVVILVSSFTSNANQDKEKPVGIETWPGVIDRQLEVSHKRGYLLCVSLYKHEAVSVVDLGENKKPLDYRYSLVGNADRGLASQLDALVHTGFMDKVVTGNKAEYRLLPRGWGLSPNDDGFDRNICLETGKWHVDRVTDYQVIADQGSGLGVYVVNAEKTYREYEWVKGIDRTLFKLKRIPPKSISGVLLIRGPEGYFVASSNRRQLLQSLPKLPDANGVELLIGANEDFLKSYCEFERWVNKRSTEPCMPIDYLNTAPNIDVYYVGVSKGNAMVFKFVDRSDPNVPHLGKGWLSPNSEGGFEPQMTRFYL